MIKQFNKNVRLEEKQEKLKGFSLGTKYFGFYTDLVTFVLHQPSS